MNLKNRIQLIGNLGATPSIVEYGGGNKLARFSIATTDVYKKNNKYVKDTTWHTIVALGKLAEIAESKLSVGIEVVVDGSLRTRNYTDKDGIKRYVSEVIANTILFRATNKETGESSDLEKQSA